MEQDQQLKSLFQRLDTSVQEAPTPQLANISCYSQIHRFKSPWSKWLEWVINGGAGMTILFGLVALSSIFWSGMSFGWLGVPLTLFVIRPFLGRTPVKRPGRMFLVLVLGCLLSTTIGTAIDFAVYCYPNRASLLLLSFFIENSVSALLVTELAVSSFLLLTVAVVTCVLTARRYPWLQRSVRISPWRTVVSCLILVSVIVTLGYLRGRVNPVHPQNVVAAALKDPRINDIEHGASLGHLRGSVSPDVGELKVLAAKLVTAFRDKRAALTSQDLELAYGVLNVVSFDGNVEPDFLYTELWWELLKFYQDYSITTEGRPLANQIMYRNALLPLAEKALSEERAEAWLSELESRPLRNWHSVKELRELLAVHATSPPTSIKFRSYNEYLATLESRYLLLRLTYPSSDTLAMSDFAVLSSRGAEAKLGGLQEQIWDRLHLDQQRAVLTGVLRARLNKMRDGEYPKELSLAPSDFRYEITTDGPIITRDNWLGKEELVCRLPR